MRSQYFYVLTRSADPTEGGWVKVLAMGFMEAFWAVSDKTKNHFLCSQVLTEPEFRKKHPGLEPIDAV